jgi:hypothetical protein
MSLSLVFRDLWQNLNSELFDEKAKLYYSMYQSEIQSAYSRCAIDANLDGTASIFGDFRSGIINR